MLYLRKKKIKKCKNAYLLWKPQTKWIIQKVTTMTPKKPNSATRKVIKVKLTTWKFSYVYIPGIGHNLKKFCTVLIKGWRTQDLPWLKLKAMR